MAFWERQAAATNLRLYVPEEGWKAYADKQAADGRIEAAGARGLIESVFLNALNATNLIFLAGTGASFAAKNRADKKQPAGMAALWTGVQKKVGEEQFKTTCGMFPSAPIDENIERLLTLCKLYLELNEKAQDKARANTAQFVKDAELAILDTVDFIDGETSLDAHATVIQKIGRRGVRKPRARFFTTNYDLCFEEAARRHRFTIIDGFSHALDQVYDRSHFDHDIVRREQGKDAPDYVENVFHLYKLHGSIDWRRIGSEIVRSRDSKGEPVLIYPRSSKYQESFGAPYLDMIAALQAALREPDTALIVSGFGFRDDHLSRPIVSAVEANMSMRLIVCDPVFVQEGELAKEQQVVAGRDPPDNKFLAAFLRLAKGGDPRIHLMNGRFEDMALALPDLVGETDRERHAVRIRTLRDEMEPQS